MVSTLFTKANAFMLMLAMMVMVALLTMPAQAQSAEALTGPLVTGAQQALTAGFGVAAVLLVGFLIYKAVRRFTSA